MLALDPASGRVFSGSLDCEKPSLLFARLGGRDGPLVVISANVFEDERAGRFFDPVERVARVE